MDESKYYRRQGVQKHIFSFPLHNTYPKLPIIGNIYFGLRLLPATGLEKSATRPVHRRELRLTDDS